MTSLQNAIGTLPGYIVYFSAFLLTLAQLSVLLECFRTKQAGKRTLTALLHFLLGFLFLTVLLDFSYYTRIYDRPVTLYDFEFRLFSAPWLLFTAVEAVSAWVIWLYARAFRRYRETRLSADAIRQTVDLLPTALMISDPDGTVLLANLKMAALCRSLTGELLSDAGRFWRFIESNQDQDRLVHTASGETWQFVKTGITVDGRAYDQVTASEMTEQYRVTKELKDKNEHLRQVQFRMRSVAARERSLAAAREVMNARMTVHDRMGGVLLSGKYYLDHPEDMKEEELLHLLEYSNYFLLGEVEQPRQAVGDPLEDAIRLARRIGVKVEIIGALPETEPARALVAQAVDQCATNAVRHAGGDRLTVVLDENETSVTAAFSNNGAAPKGPITETGGLAVLRKAVEAAGGNMRIQSQPEFLLTLTIPKEA